MGGSTLHLITQQRPGQAAVVCITWPDVDLTLPSLSKLAPCRVEMEISEGVSFGAVFEI